MVDLWPHVHAWRDDRHAIRLHNTSSGHQGKVPATWQANRKSFVLMRWKRTKMPNHHGWLYTTEYMTWPNFWMRWVFFSLPFLLSCVHMIDVATADDKNVRLSIINFCHKWWISLLLKQDNINGEEMKTKREEVVPKAKHLSTNSFTHLAFLALSTFVEGSADRPTRLFDTPVSYRPTRLLIPMSYCLVLKICSRSRTNSIGLCCFSSLSL